MAIYENDNELYHHGIIGQKWGVRRFQNEDGSLTPSGKLRYGDISGKAATKIIKKDIKKDNQALTDARAKAEIKSNLALKYKRYDKSAYRRLGKHSSAKQRINAYDLGEIYTRLRFAAEHDYKEYKKMINYTISKYGEKAVKDITKSKEQEDGRIMIKQPLIRKILGDRARDYRNTSYSHELLKGLTAEIKNTDE